MDEHTDIEDAGQQVIRSVILDKISRSGNFLLLHMRYGETGMKFETIGVDILSMEASYLFELKQWRDSGQALNILFDPETGSISVEHDTDETPLLYRALDSTQDLLRAGFALGVLLPKSLAGAVFDRIIK